MQPETITIDLQYYQLIGNIVNIVLVLLFSIIGAMWALDRKSSKSEMNSRFDNVDNKLKYIEKELEEVKQDAKSTSVRLTDYMTKR